MSSTPHDASPIDIRHEGERFLANVDGIQAHLDYRRDADTMVINHTRVPDEIGGRGIAGELTRTAFEYARSQGWKVRPVCSYAAGWANRHPEYSQLLA